ncbi:hypothetical protein Lsan_2475 [Legionella santicrucis]|uniref:Deacetylase sirtuin-type domain-containing protein n=1 Tax=Legionella santicrucis TaxID=45074 RepID=A0A0W0YPM2_9GAMM|nr:hypothetical protein [Legionella santicrucis]KTD58860.1 hypothetical protein Lsan_2475 [Legionella santicrucis]
MNEFNEILEVTVEKAHVFILGAGVSIASFPEGDKNKKTLPSMQNFINILGIADLVPTEFSTENDFEIIYSKLCQIEKYKEQKEKIEIKIKEYFSDLRIKDEVCIYDYLLLSLRPKDVLATFNWDPFLVQAYLRNDKKYKNKLPRILFLHGNVESYYCNTCLLASRKGCFCPNCNEKLLPSNLLYPIQKKNYDEDRYINTQWSTLQFFLKDSYLLSIYGYSAPKSDISAKEKIFNGWREQNEKQPFDLVEIIDRKGCDKESIKSNWREFIFSHHSRVYEDIFDCFALRHPRRSGEAYVAEKFNGEFIPSYVPPKTDSLEELWDWYEARVVAEK